MLHKETKGMDMATGMGDVTRLYAARHGELGLTPDALPRIEQATRLDLASPETVARNIARRARIRTLATLAPLAFLVGVLLLVVVRAGF